MAKLATLPPAAAANLAREARDAAIRAGVLAFIALVLGGVVRHALAILAIGLTAGGLIVAAAYALIAFRAFSIRRRLPAEARRIIAIGWTRTPDGTNYAIFPTGGDTLSTPPELVLKLTRARDVAQTRAFLLGGEGSRSAALVDEKGAVLAVGRLRGAANGQKVWQHRAERTPWWAGAGNHRPPDAKTRR
ncbi:MAG: hypothetical protein ABI317_07320 [Gaiellales bacterium]